MENDTQNFDYNTGPARAHPGQAGPTRADAGRPEAPKNNDILQQQESDRWLTVREAAEEFRRLGLPRGVEAIRKYAREGTIEANTIAGPSGDQHVVKASSIAVYVAEQKKVLSAVTRNIPVQSETYRADPGEPGPARAKPGMPGQARVDPSRTEAAKTTDDTQVTDKDVLQEKDKEISKLKRELRDAKIDLEVRSKMVGMLEDREKDLMNQVGVYAKEAGQLQERLDNLQLAAPTQEPQSAPDPVVHESDAPDQPPMSWPTQETVDEGNSDSFNNHQRRFHPNY